MHDHRATVDRLQALLDNAERALLTRERSAARGPSQDAPPMTTPPADHEITFTPDPQLVAHVREGTNSPTTAPPATQPGEPTFHPDPPRQDTPAQRAARDDLMIARCILAARSLHESARQIDELMIGTQSDPLELNTSLSDLLITLEQNRDLIYQRLVDHFLTPDTLAALLDSITTSTSSSSSTEPTQQLPKLNVGSSILLARFVCRRCHTMTPAAFRWQTPQNPRVPARWAGAAGSGRTARR